MTISSNIATMSIEDGQWLGEVARRRKACGGLDEKHRDPRLMFSLEPVPLKAMNNWVSICRNMD